MFTLGIKISLGTLVIASSVWAQPEPPAPPPAPSPDVFVDLDEIKRSIAPAKVAADVWQAMPKLPPMPPIPPMKDLNELAFQMDRLHEKFAFAMAQPPQPPQPPQPGQPGFKWQGRYNPERNSEDHLYRSGTRHLDRREYEPAVEAFDAAAAKKGSKADGAYYWKAYALSKLGRRDESLAVLNELQKAHPNSRWLDDAKALGVEVRQASGQAVSPENQTDEEVKLMALNAIMQSDPDRAVPLLEKILSRGGSPKLKERALFVLAQSRTPQAREMVVQFAKGKGNPDLQYKAVEYLGMHGGSTNVQVLGEIYSSTTDPTLKRRLLQSFMVTGDKERLLNAAKSESDIGLRREAVQLLGGARAIQELVQLYASETNVEVKQAILHGLFAGGAHDRLIELAKSETEPKLRRQAIHHLGAMGRSSQAADALVAMYGTETDQGMKRQILDSLFMQQNVTRIIEIARKETDPQLKRSAIEKLSHMKSKEATDFLVELLNK